MSNPVLYVFVNTDLESMNFGKAMAQSAHAANAFVSENIVNNGLVTCVYDDLHEHEKLLMDWYHSTTQGFGTQLNMKAGNFKEDLADLYAYWMGDDTGVRWGEVIDPTYPFEVSAEVYELLDQSKIVSSFVKSDGRVACSRKEITSFYIFGDKDNDVFRETMKKYKLHP